jgi:predicted O-linked N-acetylglucosamine transferase (SPINDLY family)
MKAIITIAFQKYHFLRGLKLKKKRKKPQKKERQRNSSSVRNISLDIEPILAQAIEHHQTGNLHQAEQLCEKILSINPHHGEALHMLAVIFCQRGKQAAAVELFQRAININPGKALYYYNFGNACKDIKHFDEAIRCYNQVLELKPDYIKALNNLGIVFHQQERYEEAAAAYQQALKIDPGSAEVYYNLANTLRKLELPKEAVLCYRKALDIKPDFPEVYNCLGSMFDEQGNLAAAIQCYQQVLQSSPDNEETYFNLAVLYKKLEQFNDAIVCYQKAITLSPECVVFHNNLGNLLQDRGRLSEAGASLRRALVLQPDYAEAHNNLGNLLLAQGRLKEAEGSFRRALELQPERAEIHNNLGNTLKKQGRLKGAEASLWRALELNSEYAAAHNSLGSVFIAQGRSVEAEVSSRRALELKPDYVHAHSTLLFVMNYQPDKTAEEIYADYRAFDQQFGLPLRKTWRPHTNSCDVNRRLKVGYVAPTFCKHSVRHFLEPLLAHHDREVVEVYAYADLFHGDEVTERYKSYVDHWVPIRVTTGDYKELDDNELAERIRADGIDVLVDIAGHTMGNRLLMFARKPAPVSLHWLDFGYTTGLTAIDYYLADDVVAPVGCEGLFSETLWRVETPAVVYRPAEGMGSVSVLPALERGYITFGTLSRVIRLNDRTLRVWAEILRRVEDSRLIIDSSYFNEDVAREEMAEKFARYGIGRERLEIGCHSPPWDVMRGMDVMFDCFPHNSGTTLFESLYMGIPFVSLTGRPSVGCLGSSILEGVGHPEWIARTEDEYVEIAVALAADLPKLAVLRAGMRTEMKASPLMDEPGFARKVENAYREMFAKWCEKKYG